MPRLGRDQGKVAAEDQRQLARVPEVGPHTTGQQAPSQEGSWAASPVTRRQLGSKPRHKKAAGQQAPSQEGSWAASPVTKRQLGSKPRHKKAAGKQAPSQEGSWAASPVTRRQLGSKPRHKKAAGKPQARGAPMVTPGSKCSSIWSHQAVRLQCSSITVQFDYNAVRFGHTRQQMQFDYNWAAITI